MSADGDIGSSACGGSGAYVGVRGEEGNWYVRCLRCNAKGPVGATPQEAIALWNVFSGPEED